MRAIISALSMALLTVPATAATPPKEPGMFLCETVAQAASFWNEASALAASGVVTVDREMGHKLATKHDCHFIAGANLKPIDYRHGGVFIMTDGKVHGFSHVHQYILYVNR